MLHLQLLGLLRLYEELGLESLSKRRWYRRMCLFWKIINNSAPKYLTILLPSTQHSRNPNRQSLFSSFYKNTDYFANSFFAYCTDQWNLLDPDIKNIQSISLSKKLYSSLFDHQRPMSLMLLTILD